MVGLTHMKTVMTLEYQDTTQTLGLDSEHINRVSVGPFPRKVRR